MSTSTLGLFLRHLALSEEVNRLRDDSDHDLLAAYEPGRSQAAFTELMRRHGPMVLRTCRRILGHGPDAEDAFQATFLLLARSAGKLRREVRSLGGWLHHVACRTALNVLRGAARRGAHERQPSVTTHPQRDPSAEAAWNEIQPILDAELDALPDEARRLLIAFYLEEKTYTEVAEELGLPRGSLVWHLEKARALLAARLARRGITVSAGLLAVLLEESAKGAVVPAVLLVHTVEAARRFTHQATGIVSENVIRLVKGGLANMTRGWTRWSMMLAGWVGLLGVGLIACQTLKAWPEQTPQSKPSAAVEGPAQEGDKPARTDCFGDPLPPGALARMGTMRLFNGGKWSGSDGLLALSPDGKILASRINRKTVALWDAATGKEIRRLTADPVPVGIPSLGFTPDGKTLVVVDGWDKKVCLWEVATGKLRRTVAYQGFKRYDWMVALAFLPDGRMLAATGFQDIVNGQEIFGTYIWDLATGKEVRQLIESREQSTHLDAIVFSRDGKLLATADKNNITLWDVATGKEIRQLTHPGVRQKRGLAFSPDGKILASANAETISVWDVTTGKPLRHMKAQSNSPVPGVPLAFSPDGKTLMGGGEGHLWEVGTGKEIRTLGLKNTLKAIFSPDGKILTVVEMGGTIGLWEVATGKKIFPRPGHRLSIEMVAYAPDGKTLASIDGIAGVPVRLWDVTTGKELRQLAKPAKWGIRSIAYSPDGKMLASTDWDVVYLWDTATGKEIRQFQGRKGIFYSVTFSPDSKKLAAGMGQGDVVVLYEVATGKEIYQLETSWPGPFAFSPDGRMLIAPRKGNTVSIWEVATGKLIGQLGGPNQPDPRVSVQFLAFSPDGRVVATSSSHDDKVRLWEVATGKQIGQLHVPRWYRRVLAFSPDGRILATAARGQEDGEDLAVTLWEVASGQEIGRLSGHRNLIKSLAFSPDGKTLASGSDDLTCLIWDVASVAGRLKPATADALSSKVFSREELQAAWVDLASADAAKAYRAVLILRLAQEQAIPLLKERVRPVAPIADPKQLARWIADLDNESFAVRDKAQRAIERLGEPAIPTLRRALGEQPPLEKKQRLQTILAAVEPKLVAGSSSQLRHIRAVQALESIATPEARQVLQDLAKGVAEASLTREAQAALERLARRAECRP